MKIDDIASLLANRINQEHHVRTYLLKIAKAAYEAGAKDALDELNNLQNND